MRTLCTWAFLSLLLVFYNNAHGQVTAESLSTKRTISLDVQRTDVREILRLIAAAGQVNIIASSDVQGLLTLRLVDVPWERALDAVVKLAGLGKERQGNVILLAPLERLQAHAEQHQRKQQAAAQIEPRITRVIQLNYATATTLQAHLTTLLGSCATIQVDERTNSLLLTGTPTCLRPAQELR